MKRLALLLFALSAAAHAAQLTDLQNLTPHSAHTLNPVMLTTGDICWSEWTWYGPRAKGLTPANGWQIYCSDGNGADTLAELGAHGGPTFENRSLIADWCDPARCGEGSTTIKALRPVAEIYPGYLATTNYYRGNSTGAMGKLFGWSYDKHTEGAGLLKNVQASLYKSDAPGSGRYIPGDLQILTPYGLDQDANGIFHKDGRIAGRAGYPAPWPGDGPEFLFTHARGHCYEDAIGSAGAAGVTRKAMGGEPTCQKCAYKAKQAVVKNPFDSAQAEPLACDEKWQIYDARAVSSYANLFGQQLPLQPKPIAPGPSFLQVVNIALSELPPFPNATANDKVTFQGNANPAYPALIMDGGKFCLDAIELWDGIPTRQGWKRTLSTNCVTPEKDGSLRMQVLADVPFRHYAIDKNRVVIAESGVLDSLRPGETRTCHGCHDGHSEERGKTLPAAAEAFKLTIAGEK